MPSRKKIDIARSLRQRSTKSEALLWQELRNRKFMNLKFRRQHVIRGFVVDFYCAELKLAIEIDGAIHRHRKLLDELRQDVIEREGVEFVRFSAKEVENDIASVLEKLKIVINYYKNFPPLHGSGEGERG
ncbi:endonuclease domain-containing protein [Patescibacteria group bacterium]|nr:endonuclease domain-containing protein [Patescibacteria group bacterium]MBU1964131.1 endonuclease domain-containing protein [Patescibacteria group bacterium]